MAGIRETRDLVQMVYAAHGIKSISLEELVTVLHPLMIHLAMFRNIIAWKKQRIRPMEQRTFLTGLWPNKVGEGAGDTFSRVQWLMDCLQQHFLPSRYPYGDYFPTMGAAKEHIGIYKDAVQRLKNPVQNINECIEFFHRRKILERRAELYFTRFASRSINTGLIKLPQPSRMLHIAHFTSILHACFGLSHRLNDKLIDKLRELVYPPPIESQTKQNILYMFSSMATFEAILGDTSKCTINDITSEKTLSKDKLQNLVHVQLWGTSPSNLLQHYMCQNLTAFPTITRQNWLQSCIQVQDMYAYLAPDVEFNNAIAATVSRFNLIQSMATASTSKNINTAIQAHTPRQ